MILIAFLFALVFFRSSVMDRKKQYPLFELDRSWSISRNGEPLEDRDLYRLNTPGVNAGDRWVLETKLPGDHFAKIPGAALSFNTLQSAVRVCVGGEEVFSYGTERFAAHRMLKRGICLVPLPDSFSGKELRIEFTATEPIAFNGLGPVLFGSEEELFLHFLEQRRVPLFLGVFLCLYALFQLFFLPILLADMRRLATPLVGSFLSLDMGLYILSFYYLFGFFTRMENFNTYLEYLSLYLMPLCFSVYLYTVLDGKLKKLYLTFIQVDMAFIIAVVMLHAVNLTHITLYLQIFYIVSFLESVPYLVGARRFVMRQQEIMPDRLNHVARIVVYVGFFVYLICSLLDTLLYAYAKFIGGAEPEQGIPFFCAGAIVFSLSVTIQYFLQGIAHLQADVTKNKLEERAYTDALTGLSNRTRCEMEMQKMSASEPFVIISMDIDNLKTVNDTFGHAEGDRLLSTFAGVLLQCFGDAHLLGRMGGDEFIVILTGPQRTLLDAKINEMRRALLELNLEEKNFRYEVSFGFADNRETHLGSHVRDIYMLADRRMYDAKRRRRQELAQ